MEDSKIKLHTLLLLDHIEWHIKLFFYDAFYHRFIKQLISFVSHVLLFLTVSFVLVVSLIEYTFMLNITEQPVAIDIHKCLNVKYEHAHTWARDVWADFPYE